MKKVACHISKQCMLGDQDISHPVLCIQDGEKEDTSPKYGVGSHCLLHI